MIALQSDMIAVAWHGQLLGVTGAPIRHYVNQTPSVYAMDTWKVTPRLSLQLGLRYDALPQAWERNNQVATFDPCSYLAVQAPNWLVPMDRWCPTGPGFQTFNGSAVLLERHACGWTERHAARVW